MKKFTFTTIKTLVVAFALGTMTIVTTTSCNPSDVAEDVVDGIADGIGNTWDFHTAAESIKEYSDWNSATSTYDKSFGSYDDAVSTLKRYTNRKMNIPGTWKLSNENIITVENDTNNSMFVIKVKDTTYDENNRATVDQYTAHFIYK